MSKLKDWSTTAAANDLAVPEGWPEGMTPGNVNNVGRQVMARTREWYNDAQWLELGHTVNSATGTTIVFSGDVLSQYPTGRALRADGVEGTVVSSSLSTNTTVIVNGITFAGAPTLLEVGISTSTNRRLSNGTTKVETLAKDGNVTITAPTVAITGALSVSSTLTATLGVTGNASTATKLQTARNIALTGDVTGTTSFDGSGNVSIATTLGGIKVMGWGRIGASGGVIAGSNISSASYNAGSKAYTITTTTGTPSVVFANCLLDVGVGVAQLRCAEVTVPIAGTFTVIFSNASAAVQSSGFNVVFI